MKELQASIDHRDSLDIHNPYLSKLGKLSSPYEPKTHCSIEIDCIVDDILNRFDRHDFAQDLLDSI